MTPCGAADPPSARAARAAAGLFYAAGGRRPAVPHHGRAPEAEQSVLGAFERQLEGHRPPGMVAEIEPPRLPAVRERHGPPPDAGAVDGHVERDRVGLDRPDRDVQPGPIGQIELDGDALRRPADDGLAVDLPQPLPSGPGGHRPEVLSPRDEPHRLDLEGGAFLVGRLDEQMPDAGNGERPCDVLQGVGLDVVARLELGEERRRRSPADAPQDALLVQLARPVERHADPRPGGDAHGDLYGVQQVALVELLGPRRVQQGQLARGADQEPVPDLEALDVVVGRPADGGSAVLEVLRLLFILGRFGGGDRPLAVEAPLRPLERLHLDGLLDGGGVEEIEQTERDRFRSAPARCSEPGHEDHDHPVPSTHVACLQKLRK